MSPFDGGRGGPQSQGKTQFGTDPNRDNMINTLKWWLTYHKQISVTQNYDVLRLDEAENRDILGCEKWVSNIKRAAQNTDSVGGWVTYIVFCWIISAFIHPPRPIVGHCWKDGEKKRQNSFIFWCQGSFVLLLDLQWFASVFLQSDQALNTSSESLMRMIEEDFF